MFQFKNKNELEDSPVTMKIKNGNEEKKSDEDDNHLEFKDSQNNSEDGKEELELSEMIVCDEVAGDSDEVCLLFIMLSFMYNKIILNFNVG